MQRVNNLSAWIRSRVVLGWCCSAALRLIGGRITVCGASLGLAVSSAVVLAAKFRAGFNMKHSAICIYLYTE